MAQVFAGRYELLDPIAEGGMGSVWRVLDRREGEVRAAKLLRQVDASSLLRFMREQSTRIHHPHVVTPLSWAGEDDVVLFTMPLVRGGSVATLIGDHGPLPEQWVAEVLDQLLDGLSAVHAAGVVHRDVKPANVLLEPTGSGRPVVRLTDFGIAAPLDQPRLTHVSQAVGTAGYMAPEAERGADPDPRQDVYAAATVGLEMLTAQRPPFVDPLPTSPLVDALVAARHPDPARRPPTAAALRAAVAAAAPVGEWGPGEVVVLDQFAESDETAPQQRAEQRQPRGRTKPDPTAVRASAPSSASRSSRSLLAPLGLAALGALLLVAAVLILV